MFITREDLEQLTGPLTDTQWNLVEGSDWIREMPLEQLAVKVRTAFATERAVRPRVARREDLSPVREQIVSALIAIEAAGREDVSGFRADVLGDRTLSLAEVEAWVGQHGAGTLWLEVPLPSGHAVEPDGSGFRVKPPLSLKRLDSPIHLSRRRLFYVDEAGNETSIETSTGSVTEALRALAETLSTDFGWTTAQAATFVLTDAVPLLEEISVKPIARSQPAADRIVLEVDPAVRAERVAAEYQRCRTQHVLGRGKGMSEKHLTLARFAAEREGSWREKLDAWNATYPDWRYARVQNFNRDARLARRRLLGTTDDGHRVYHPDVLAHYGSQQGREEER